MKICLWIMIFMVASVALARDTDEETREDCESKWTTSNPFEPELLPMQSKRLTILYKAHEDCNATVTIKEDGKKKRYFQETWPLTATDEWLKMIVQNPLQDTGKHQGVVVIPGRYYNGKYLGFEMVDSVEVSSTGNVTWSTTDLPCKFFPSEPELEEEPESTTLPEEPPTSATLLKKPPASATVCATGCLWSNHVLIGTVAAVILVLIVIINILVCCLIKARKCYGLENVDCSTVVTAIGIARNGKQSEIQLLES